MHCAVCVVIFRSRPLSAAAAALSLPRAKKRERGSGHRTLEGGGSGLEGGKGDFSVVLDGGGGKGQIQKRGERTEEFGIIVGISLTSLSSKRLKYIS